MRTKIEVFVAVCLIGLAMSFSLRLRHEQQEREQAEQVRDSLFLEEAANNAALDGWAVKFGTLQKDMNGEFARRDSMAARLVKDLDKAHAQIRSLVEVVVSLNDSLTSVGTPTDTTEAGAVTYTGTMDDGLLRATWGFLAPELSLTYGVTVPLELVTSEAGGRWMLVARSKDPRVVVSVPTFYFSPPTPTQVCTMGQKAKVFGLGSVIGILAGYGIAR